VVAARGDEGAVEGGEQGNGLAELRDGHGGDGDGGHDGHGACGQASRGRTVVPPASAHGGDTCRARGHGAPSAAPRHWAPEPVLLPAGRRGEAMRRRSTRRAQWQERRGGQWPSCLRCSCFAPFTAWLVCLWVSSIWRLI
jgi:hypothetical protein